LRRVASRLVVLLFYDLLLNSPESLFDELCSLLPGVVATVSSGLFLLSTKPNYFFGWSTSWIQFLSWYFSSFAFFFYSISPISAGVLENQDMLGGGSI